MEERRKTPLVFYRTAAGGEPVREWLKGLDKEDRHAIGLDLMRAQWRWPIGMPLCRPMRAGLWEVRTDLPSARIARVLFLCAQDSNSGAACLHQEDAGDAERRLEARKEAEEGS